MVTPDAIASFETRLLHYENEIELALADPDYDPQSRLPLQDAYFYGCTLVDQCLARHLVPVSGDDERGQVLARLSRVDESYLPVRMAFMDFYEGYQFRIAGSPVSRNIPILTNFPRLLLALVSAVVRVCPP